MDNRSYKDIELDKVLEIVKAYSLSEYGKQLISASAFTRDEEVLNSRYVTIDTYINYLDEESRLDNFPSIKDVFDYVKRTHADIDGKDIYKTGEFLNSYFLMLSFLHQEDEIKEEDQALSSEILTSLDYEGDVVEDHPRLRPLIKARDELKAERFRYSSQYITANKNLVQNVNPVFRNERVVIPIRADQTREKDIYVMGSSSSGSTLFVEPFELVDLNNKVVLSEERIRAEKIKIKHELSEKVRFLVPILVKMVRRVADFDFHYSFASWCKKVKATHPERSTSIELNDAVHPLLGTGAVPITIKLDDEIKVLVLSGANAGGKTVSMKTVALLVALNQICGFIPARMDSKLPLFDDIFTDIGDGQSIEEAFSTFSGHMSNIARIISKATPYSLVVLDELGSGTDPEEGASLSIAILKYLSTHTRLTISTSHYGQVKNFAYANKNMLNASMEFNEKSEKPTYRILEGIPGDSHAIATAIRAHLPKEITEEAKALLSSGDETSASIITSLLSKSRTLDRKISQQESARREAEKKLEKIKSREDELKSKELEVEKIGYKELSDYLSESRKKLEKLIYDISTGELTKDKIKDAKAFIEESSEFEDKIHHDIKKKEKTIEKKMEIEVFNVGDDVVSKSAKTRGKVLEVKGKNRYYVSFENGLRMDVKGAMLEHAQKEKGNVAHFQSSAKKAQFVLDLRGKTLQEAIECLDDQLEAAILDDLSSFSIIHGYGDGILQRGINEYLKKRKEVKSLAFARPEDGGMGKTYVTLNL